VKTAKKYIRWIRLQKGASSRRQLGSPISNAPITARVPPHGPITARLSHLFRPPWQQLQFPPRFEREFLRFAAFSSQTGSLSFRTAAWTLVPPSRSPSDGIRPALRCVRRPETFVLTYSVRSEADINKHVLLALFARFRPLFRPRRHSGHSRHTRTLFCQGV